MFRLAGHQRRVEQQYRHAVWRQVCLHALLAQQQVWRGIVEHVGQALLRVPRVQRQIGAAGLEHAQQASDHVGRALGADRHQRVGANTLRAQIMRKAVGAGVQFGKAHLGVAKQQRRRVRRARHLCFEQRVDGFIAVRIDRRRVVPGCQHLLRLVWRQHCQRVDARARSGQRRLQQLHEVPRHALNCCSVEQGGAVLECGTPLPRRILDQVQRQVELGDLAFGAHRRQRQARHLQGLHRRILQDHHDLEQRRVALMALQLQCLDQLLERHILVGISVERGAAHLVKQIDEAGGAVGTCTQGEHVQKEADQRFDFSPVTIRNCSADADVMLTAVARQQNVKDGIEQHEWRRPG